MEDSNRLTLQEVARRVVARTGVDGGRAMDRLAKSRDLTLSYTTFNKILAGGYNSRPQHKTLDALAELAGLPRADVYEAAKVPLPLASFADQLPPDADLLTGEQRRVVIDMVRVLTSQQRLIYEARQTGEAGDRDGQAQAAPMNQTDELATRRRSVNEDPPAPLEGAAREAPEGGSQYEQLTRGIDGAEEDELQ